MAQNLNNPINRAGGPVDDRTEVQHESDIDSLESTYVGQLVHVRDNDKFFRIKSVDVLGSPTSKEVVAYTEITSDKIASWDGKQDAITPTNTLSPSNIKDTNMNGKLAAYNSSGVLGSSGIATANIAVKSEMSITDGTGADAGTATIQLKSGTSKKVLTQHQSLDGKVDKVTGKGLSTNDYDNTEKEKVANAIQIPSATENDKIPVMRNGSIQWESKPSDGRDGAQGPKGDNGKNAVNPFKGYYPSGVSKPATGAVGDYLYAPPSDSQSTAAATIWHYDANQTPPWTDTGIDVSAVVGVEFGSGQQVNAVDIVGSLTAAIGDDDVFGAKLGVGVCTHDIKVNWEYGGVGISDSNVINIHKKSTQNKYGAYHSNFIKVRSAAAITCSGVGSGITLKIYWWRENRTYGGTVSFSNGAANLNSDMRYIVVDLTSSSALTINDIKDISFTVKAVKASVVRVPNIMPSSYTDELKVVQKRFIPMQIVKGGYGDGVISEGTVFSSTLGLLKGVVRLPKSYTEDGKKTDFIWFCRGSSAPNNDNFEGIYEDYIVYLLKEGFAVVDCSVRCNESYDETTDTSYMYQYYCTPSQKATIKAFYNFLIREYNFNERFFTFGKSQGGLKLTDIVASNLPVRAACWFAARATPFDSFFGSDDKSRNIALSDMGFNITLENNSFTGDYAFLHEDGSGWSWNDDRRAFVTNNLDKFAGICPLMNLCVTATLEEWFDKLSKNQINIWIAAKEKAKIKCPTIFFGSDTDDVFYGESMYAYTAFKNGGCTAVKNIVSGVEGEQHHAVDTLCPTTDVVTINGDTVTGVPITYAEMVKFFRRCQ